MPSCSMTGIICPTFSISAKNSRSALPLCYSFSVPRLLSTTASGIQAPEGRQWSQIPRGESAPADNRKPSDCPRYQKTVNQNLISSEGIVYHAAQSSHPFINAVRCLHGKIKPHVRRSLFWFREKPAAGGKGNTCYCG